MKKNGLIFIIMMLLLGNVFFVNTVKAEDVYGSESSSTEMFDYEDENDDDGLNDDESLSDVKEKNEVIFEKSNDDDVGASTSRINGSLIFVEIFCGAVGIFMLFLAMKTNES